MGGGAVSQLLLGLVQGDVEALLDRRGALQPEAQRDRCLAGSGISFKPKYMSGGEAAPKHIVKSADRFEPCPTCFSQRP